VSFIHIVVDERGTDEFPFSVEKAFESRAAARAAARDLQMHADASNAAAAAFEAALAAALKAEGLGRHDDSPTAERVFRDLAARMDEGSSVRHHFRTRMIQLVRE